MKKKTVLTFYLGEGMMLDGEIHRDGTYLELWLYHRDYSIKEFLFGYDITLTDEIKTPEEFVIDEVEWLDTKDAVKEYLGKYGHDITYMGEFDEQIENFPN